MWATDRDNPPQLVLSRENEDTSTWWRFRKVEDPRKSDGKVFTAFPVSLSAFIYNHSLREGRRKRWPIARSSRRWSSHVLICREEQNNDRYTSWVAYDNFCGSENLHHDQGTPLLKPGFIDFCWRMHKPHTVESFRKWASQHAGFH
jgi:hypothetical protein